MYSSCTNVFSHYHPLGIVEDIVSERFDSKPLLHLTDSYWGILVSHPLPAFLFHPHPLQLPLYTLHMCTNVAFFILVHQMLHLIVYVLIYCRISLHDNSNNVFPWQQLVEVVPHTNCTWLFASSQ